jgi:polyhydroxyalkanoate synthase
VDPNDWLQRWERAHKAVGSTPADAIFRENKWRLLHYRGRPGPPGRTPILLVPSLINRHYVLDLLPDLSFVGHLVKEGHDVFLIDWGTPGDEDRYLEFDTVVDRYLGRAVRATARAAGAEKVHLMGYCLGGTLATIFAAAHPEQVASLANIAAPIDFIDHGLLSLWTRTASFDIGALVEALGNVPWPLMQGAFRMLRPTLDLAKGAQLLSRLEDDEFLDGFFALETWGNDNVSFPGACYRRYVEQLYRDNALVRGTFRLSGRPIALESIEAPCLVVSFEHDNIVPPASAAVLLERVRSRNKLHLAERGGHVGAMVSRRAAAKLWPRLSRWWSGDAERSVIVHRTNDA